MRAWKSSANRRTQGSGHHRPRREDLRHPWQTGSRPSVKTGRRTARRVALLLLATVAVVPPATAADDAVEPRRPGDRDACPVCGMFVAGHPEWLAQIVFDDGSAAFFDGARDLFKYLLARDEYDPRRSGLGIAAIFVTGYYDLQPLPAKEAWYVAGSDVHGPMGPELVPHKTRAEAEEFLRDHGGREILRFEDIERKQVTTWR